MARLRGEYVETTMNRIIDMINHYELSPGDTVSDLELSKQFDISRTPVREAINNLVTYGLLERQKTKTVVKAITFKDVLEVLQVRECVETMSIKLIIQNGGLSAKQLLAFEENTELLATSIANGNIYENYKHDNNFHRMLVAASGNDRLLDIFNNLSLQSQRLRWITILTPGRYVATCDEHRSILKNIAHSDYDAARIAIEEHIKNTEENYRQILSEDNWNKISTTYKNLIK